MKEDILQHLLLLRHFDAICIMMKGECLHRQNMYSTRIGRVVELNNRRT